MVQTQEIDLENTKYLADVQHTSPGFPLRLWEVSSILYDFFLYNPDLKQALNFNVRHIK